MSITVEDSIVGKELIGTGSNVLEEVTDFVEASEVDNDISDGDEDSVIGEVSDIFE